MKAEKHEQHEQMKAEKKMEKTTDQTTFGNLIAALNNINVEIDEFEALDDLAVTDVRVVNVQGVLEGNNVEALNNALNSNETEIVALQAFLNDVTIEVLDENNEVLTFDNVLNNNTVAVNDVIAIDVASGELVLFVQETEAEATGTETETETTETTTIEGI